MLWIIKMALGFAAENRRNEKNGRLKTLSNYGILGVNEGLFTNDCKKAPNIVRNVIHMR